MQNNSTRLLVIVVLIFAIALLRFALLDFANFAPIAAAGIFGIYFLRKQSLGILFALLAFFVSDLILQATKGYGLYWERGIDYFALAVGLGIAFLLLSKKQNIGRALLGATLGSLAFFFISNFGVWALGNMYPKTPTGLFTCYEMGIPFYRGTLVGDLFFTAFFVGSFEWIVKQVPLLQLESN